MNHTPIRFVSTPPTNTTQPIFLASFLNRPLFHMARNQPFATFTRGSLLVFAQRHDILVSALKSLPIFIGETSISPIEHI